MWYPLKEPIASAITAFGTKWKIDAHYFAKNSFFVLIGQAVGFLRGIVSGYLVARFFDQAVYGEYQFMLSIMGLLALLGIPGMATPVARAWSRGESFSLRAITRHQLLVASIGSFALLGAIPFLGFYGKQELWPLFLCAAILFPLPPIAMVRFGSYTVGKARFDISLRANLIWSSISVVLTTCIILFYQSALLVLVVAVATPPLVYFVMSRNFRPPETKGKDESGNIIRFAWNLTFASLPADLAWYLDKLMISHFFGLNQLALFSVAILIPEQAKVFTKQFFPVAFAKQAAIIDNRATRLKLLQAVFVGTAIFVVGIAGYVILCPFVIPFLFPKYDAQQLVFLTSVAAVTLVTNPASLFAQYLEAQGMLRETRIAQWGAAVVFATLLVALIPTMGLVGALVARGVFRLAYVGIAAWYALGSPLRGAPTPA